MNLDKTLFFAHDAGGANVTMAYAHKLHKQGLHVKVYPKGPASKIYEKHIPYLIDKVPEFDKNTTVIVGTSGIHSDYEMQILKKAKKEGVKKTIVILDSIDELSMRFMLDGKKLESCYFPDEIWSKEYPLPQDFTPIHTLIKQINDPYIEYINETLYENAPSLTNPLIKKYKGEYLVILSEYVRELFGDKFGFDEYDSIKHILEAITKLQLDIPILLKTHPAEPKNKYKDLIKNSSLNLHEFEGSIHELIYYSKVVLGINSSVFHETLFLEKPTYSIQIGSILKMDDILPKDMIIYSKKELEDMLYYNFGKGSTK